MSDAFLSQHPDGGAQVGLDAVGLLEAVVEQQLGEQLANGRFSARSAVAKQACSPGANSSFSGRVATSASFLMPMTATWPEAATRRAKASVKPLNLRVRHDPVHVPVPSR